MQDKDDGTTRSWIAMTVAVIVAFCLGYALRDQGVTFQANVPVGRPPVTRLNPWRVR